MLTRIKLPHSSLQPPVNYLINSLINLDLEGNKSQQFGTDPLFPKFNQKCNADHLINILDAAVCTYEAQKLEQLTTPLITLLRKIYSVAPDDVKRYMRWLLLPLDDERIQPLGRSKTLASRLLRLTTATEAPNLRESISNLMFELSDQDVTSFVKNVGYGFTSGFLMAHNMPVVPQTAAEAWSTKETDGNLSLEHLRDMNLNINPITARDAT